jgi:hypothetical protein
MTEPLPAPDQARKMTPRAVYSVIGVIVVMLAVLGSVLVINLTRSPTYATRGSCMTGDSPVSLRLVRCSSPAAQWVVLGAVPMSQLSKYRDRSFCGNYPDPALTSWRNPDSKAVYFVCMAPKHPGDDN